MRDRRSRPRHRSGLGTESLESRRLLVATPINVATGVTIALGLPLPGLAAGSGFAATAQTVTTVAVTVAPAAPAPVPSTFGPSATGPAPTLSPLPNDSETAVAAASEVARPTPGRSDRISNFIEPPEIISLPHLRSPDEADIHPGPQIQAPPPPPVPVPAPAPAVPVEPPADPAVPARPIAPAPEAVEEVAVTSETFEVRDAALGLVATELPEGLPSSLARRTEVAMASGVLLAAWVGWKYDARRDGRSRRRPVPIAVLEASR